MSSFWVEVSLYCSNQEFYLNLQGERAA